MNLPRIFEALDDIAENLPEYTASSIEILRKKIRGLSFGDVHELSEGEFRRARLITHVIQNCYVNGEPHESYISRNLARLSFLLACVYDRFKLNNELLEHPPVLTYSSYILDNWEKIESHGPFRIENLTPLVTFTSSEDEIGFILTHVLIELIAESGKKSISVIQEAIFANDQDAAGVGLLEIALSIEKMELELMNMLARCNQQVYSNDIRPWLRSFNSVIFDGVSLYKNKPQVFRGPSGAQSSSIPIFCAALGINHKHPSVTQHFNELYRYIPIKHREFITAIKKGHSIRLFVVSHPNLKNIYNECIRAILNFRKQHFEMIQGYVQGVSTGTGGTPLKEWLKLIVDETEAHYL